MHYEKFADGTVRCIEDEIPFDVPEGWEWCRVGTVFTTITGGTPSTKDRSLYGNEYPFYKPTDLDAGFQVVTADDSVSEKGFLSGRVVLPLSVLVTCIGATIGKTGLIRTAGICNQQINAILPNSLIAPEYTYFFMCSGFGQDQIISNSSATTLPILNKSRFDNLLFALPPYKVQLKIADQIEIIMRYIDAIDCNQADINVLISTTKAHILDLAIRGKLVPQNPDDVPASVLLDRIRAEKEELIKQGKIKRDKRESVIFRGEDNSYYEKIGGETRCIDNEIPFDIPESWAFVRLKHIGEIIGGGTPKTNNPAFWDGSIAWITPADLSGYESMFISTGSRNITEAGLKGSSAQLMPAGSVLYSSRAPIGYVAIASNPLCTNQGFKSVVPIMFEMSPFLFYCLKARTDDITQRATGTTFKEISGAQMAETIIPLPPVNEQRAITSKIEKLLSIIGRIEDHIR